jgi:HPt (histidine-containing phosphotransfer) domain-containing protein
MLHETENGIIDYPSALERIGGDREFLIELLNIYVEEFNSAVEALDQAFEAQDFRAIQELGHSLKGSSANLSLIQLREHAFRIETSGEDRDLELARRSIEALKQEFLRLLNHLAENGDGN